MLEKYLPGRKQLASFIIIGVALWLVFADKLSAEVWLWTSLGTVSGAGLISDAVKQRGSKP